MIFASFKSNLGRLVPASDIYELIEQFEFSDVDHGKKLIFLSLFNFSNRFK